MKKNIFFAIFFMIPFFLCAQKKDKILHIKTIDELRLEIINIYEPNPDSVKSNCWEGCVFMRFNINNSHQLQHAAFTKTTPPFIIDALTSVVQHINKRKLNIPGLKNLNKTYILPVIIANNTGCGFTNGWEEYNKEEKLSEKEKITRERRKAEYSQFLTSIQNINNFSSDAKMHTYTNCVLLNPITLPTGMQ